MGKVASDRTSALLALSHELADSVAQAGRFVVGVRARTLIGSSGIHWLQGVVVTADYTVERDEEISVKLPDGRTVSARLAGRDPAAGLAILTIQSEFPTAKRGDAAPIKAGHVVLAVARPGVRGLSASCGIVSALSGPRGRYIHVDLRMYPGFAGGPLVDGHGRVLGLNTVGPGGVALTIPSATVDRVVNRFMKDGRIVRG
jgi:S1-C subfamily serine protease